MRKVPRPENEAERIDALHRAGILDTAPEKEFDDLTFLASKICGAPMSLITLIDTNRQWFKSKSGAGADATPMETPRDLAFCAYTILQSDVMIVPDATQDERFSENPLVVSHPGIRFYAGAPLESADGYRFGSICVVDVIPRNLTSDQIEALQALSRQVIRQMELRRHNETLEKAIKERQSAEAALQKAHIELELRVEARTAELAAANTELQSEVTERLRVERELVKAKVAAEEAYKAKSIFLSNMSHELRTPLNHIIGYSEMLMEEAEETGSKDFIPDLEKIRTSGTHLLSIINDLLDLSDIDAGRKQIYLETFDIVALVESVPAAVQKAIQKNGNELQIHCPPGIGAMCADLGKVRQSVINLISNASKFTSHGFVRLDVTREPGDWIHFAVTDSGIGIAPEMMGRIFEPFMQVDGSSTRKYEGTGLGLAIMRRFCRMMGGDVVVESTVGVGSTFTIKLPAQAEGSVDEAAAPPKEEILH